jgi:hypothetical protein
LAFTLASEAEVTPKSRYVVVDETSTVTVVPAAVFTVKLFVPTETTVPKAAGGPSRSPCSKPSPARVLGEVPAVDWERLAVELAAAALGEPADKPASSP